MTERLGFVKRIHLVAGASRGIGLAVAKHLVGQGHEVFGVSRSACPLGTWIQADLSTLEGVAHVRGQLEGRTLDGLLYMGGTWEAGAFSRSYRFEACSDEDLERVINVNLLAPIRLTQALLPALRRSSNPKLIFMGSLSGLDNYPYREVANSASKFGLRGAVHALREELRGEGIGVTVINPGNVGTDEVISDLAHGNMEGAPPIPLSDLIAVIDCVLSLSRHTCVKEIHLPAMGDH